MNKIFENVCITGAGNGIGQAIAIAMSKEGYNVICADINFEEAEKILLQIKDEDLLEELLYKKWLSRCFIHNGAASRAMDLYPSRRDQQIEFLTGVANECFLSKDFEISSKAFLKLKELDILYFADYLLSYTQVFIIVLYKIQISILLVFVFELQIGNLIG